MAKATLKKRWYRLIAPKLFNGAEVGETTAYEPKNLTGKTLSVNLSTLINDMRKQNIELNLLMGDIQGDKVETSLIGIKVLPNSIKRMVRKGKTRIDQTIKAITKDEKVVTIKMFVVTRNIVQGSVSRAIQHEIKRFVLKKVVSNSFDALTETIIFEELQKELKGKLNKIYPVKICDVKEFKLERFIKSVDLRKIKADLSKESRKPVMVEESEEAVEGQEEKKKEEVQESSEDTQEEVTEDIQEESDEEAQEEATEESEEIKE